MEQLSPISCVSQKGSQKFYLDIRWVPYLVPPVNSIGQRSSENLNPNISPKEVSCPHPVVNGEPMTSPDTPTAAPSLFPVSD